MSPTNSQSISTSTDTSQYKLDRLDLIRCAALQNMLLSKFHQMIVSTSTNGIQFTRFIYIFVKIVKSVSVSFIADLHLRHQKRAHKHSPISIFWVVRIHFWHFIVTFFVDALDSIRKVVENPNLLWISMKCIGNMESILFSLRLSQNKSIKIYSSL